ncbi:tRNA(adenine34) deaminase [Dispira simplex]|nr:tRNA(adenine34) deaminase [Dispira simplex]
MRYSEDDIQRYMKAAFAQAEKAYAQGEVPVGCVLVHNLQIIGRGRNRPNETCNATKHAELVAIEEILGYHPDSTSNTTIPTNPDVSTTQQAPFTPAVFAETDLFVTVEPCIMCASALRQLGRLPIDVGFDKTYDYGEYPPYSVYSGINKDQAVLLLRKFYLRENTNAPAPKKKSKRILKSDDLGVR